MWLTLLDMHEALSSAMLRMRFNTATPEKTMQGRSCTQSQSQQRSSCIFGAVSEVHMCLLVTNTEGVDHGRWAYGNTGRRLRNRIQWVT
jgi:hypothetical protein